MADASLPDPPPLLFPDPPPLLFPASPASPLAYYRHRGGAPLPRSCQRRILEGQTRRQGSAAAVSRREGRAWRLGACRSVAG